MIAQAFGTTRSVCVYLLLALYVCIPTNLQTISSHVCKPLLDAPHSVTTTTASITTAITSSSSSLPIAPLSSLSSNTIYSPVTISDRRPSNQHHLVQFNFSNSSISNLKLFYRPLFLPLPSYLPLPFLFLLTPRHSQLTLFTSLPLQQPPL